MVYTVEYREWEFGEVKSVSVTARNKVEAYDKAVWETLENPPYSAWVDSVTYKNGNHKRFNTFEGNPY